MTLNLKQGLKVIGGDSTNASSSMEWNKHVKKKASPIKLVLREDIKMHGVFGMAPQTLAGVL